LRIEGTFEGDIDIQGLVIIAPTGRVDCEHLRAHAVLIEGTLKGNITAERVEIASSGRVWGDVATGALSTAEGAFLRGTITMQEEDAEEAEGGAETPGDD
jgi:cytoskeletal protein CcmA (bactofilin family)